MTADHRLEDAFDRLRKALVDGQPTAPIRESIRRMESDIETARLRESEEAEAAAKVRDTAIERRAGELLAGAVARLEDDMHRFNPEEMPK